MAVGDRPAERGEAVHPPVPDFAMVFDQAPAPFLLLTPDLVIVHANRARLEATATTLEQQVGRHLFEVFPANPDDPSADGLRNLRASLELARDTRCPQTMALQKYDIPVPGGGFEERFWSPRNVPVLDERGDVVLLLHRSDDITDYVRDREAARRAVADGQQWSERVQQVEGDLFERTRELEELNAELRRSGERERRTARRLAGLAAAASALATAETVPGVLEHLAQHGRAATGAEAVVVALREGAELALTFLGGEGPAATAPTARIPLTSDAPVALAARGRPVAAGEGCRWATSVPLPGAGELPAWAAMPLSTGGGEPLGSVAVGWAEPRPLEGDEVRLLEAFAAQCAQALERVRRLQDERRRAHATRTLAEALQRSLLTEPPQPDHLQIAVRYLPAAQEAQIGGDWYDAFLTRDGSTTIVIGDVTGHDKVAAAEMGQLRGVLRGVAQAVTDPPGKIMAVFDRALHRLGVSTLATAVLARVEQTPAQRASGTRTLRWSNAGHPPPLLVEPGRAPRLLEAPADLLLGLAPELDRGDHQAPLVPGATVLLYTDGLVERRDESLDTGLDRLLEAVADLAHLPLEEFVDALLERAVPEPGDDVAVVALRAHPEDRPRPDGAGRS
ncbi:SpoIIE family protein phosphatase [Paenibacillus sp. TRM 82003]|uniref:SpoIIE family protein phosphatase n=1 Tax=Kineococcus sp. TRM81007 TaxID=2925831 RepID=UPI001F591F67|nr:SpoIIE family protein phosphatase [Kineococcus sp. TRM81007]MCI2239348.1 SpoIIE family protein phosphatase [Kineococcus sp. TRM81007]MCI3925032.1 SpoIIE family protein phosphatase [Paenibacillus sp. TRM 82003]